MNRDATLAWSLAAAGVPLLTVPEAVSGSPAQATLATADLPAALITHGDPIFAIAMVPLILFNPVAAAAAPRAAAGLPPAGNRVCSHLYTAAVAMRAKWGTRLGLAGARHDLPDLFSGSLGLPPPCDGFGSACLDAIVGRFADGTAGVVIRGAGDMLARQVDLAFALAPRQHVPASAG